MNNLVSIVIPAYNVEKFIGECLQSIQDQTLPDWEAIIVDDGSTDKTIDVIDAIIQHDRRFRLIHQQNGGVSKARNTGLLAATGTHLAFLDGDDMWEPTFLADLLQAMQAKDVNMAYCGYTHLYANGLRRKFSYPYASGRILLDVIQGKTQIHIGAMLIRKDLVDTLGLRFTEGCLVGQDQEFIWKLVSKAYVQAVPKELMVYRIRGGSAITAHWRWQKHIHALYGFERAGEYILSQDHGDYDREHLRHVLRQRIAYKMFKFIWRMIKNGYDEDAKRLMEEKKCSMYLASLDVKDMKLTDRVKYHIIKSHNRIWHKLAKIM